MAIVHRSPRKLTTIDSNLPGPGAYIAHEKNVESAFAPFSSLTERRLDDFFGNNYGPGPGSYKVREAMISKPILDILGNPTNSSFFASESQRFLLNPNQDVPGPGSYSLVKNSMICSNPWKKSVKIKNLPKTKTFPSIPTHSDINDMEITGTESVKKMKNRKFSLENFESIGPGHYDASFPTNQIGPKWVPSKVTRKITPKSTTGPCIGPGSYSEPNFDKKKNNSISFAHTTSRKILKIEPSPGPGYYYVDAIYKALHKKYPKELQSFGSRTSRFLENKKKIANIGPGSYDVNGKHKFDSKQEANVPFFSSDIRFQGEKNNNPGPGQYDSQSHLEEKGKKQKILENGFGSGQKRFENFGKNEIPGPGHYKIEMKKSIKPKRLSAVFNSQVIRELLLENSENPAPGTYETRSCFEKSEAKYKIANKIIPGTANSNSKSKKKSHNGPGPGSYTIEIKKNIQGIIRKEKRFKEPPKLEVPGPGTYQILSEDDWTKKSYNRLFIHD